MKTQNLLFIIISLSFYGTSLFAQDIIVKKDGQEIESKVIEISPVEIKYKIYNNLEGPIYSINKDELVFIRYESGEKETFSYKTKTQNIEDKETKNKYNKIEISNIEHSFHFGAVVPMGDFAEDNYYIYDIYYSEEFPEFGKKGAAAMGVGIGYEFVYPLPEKGLGLFAGIDVNYNTIQKDFRGDIEDDFDYIFNDYDFFDLEIKYSKYINIPISAGLNYTYKADDKISLYGNFGLLVNLVRISDFVVSYSYGYEYYDEDVYGSFESITKFDIENSFGYKLGGGLIINEKIIISINYLGLGEPKINAETENLDEYSVDYNGEIFEETDKVEFRQRYNLSLDILTLTVGFQF